MNTNARSALESVLRNVNQLPTLPVVYSRLQAVLGNPRVSANQVSMVIEQDQALASKMLKIVNSAYYSFPRKISTVSQAVVILGFDEIKHLALSISVINIFNKSEDAENEFDYLGFWRHSLGVAICAGLLAKKAGISKCGSHEEAFVAGLLHDIGIVVEEQYMNNMFKKALSKRKVDKLFLQDAEKIVMGFDHEETGEFLIELWKLPGIIASVTGYHHIPLARKGNNIVFSLVSVVHIADIIIRALKLGNEGDFFVPPLEKECWKCLGLNIDCLGPIINETEKLYEEMALFLLPQNKKGK